MDFIADYGLFLAKVVTFLLAAFVLVALVRAASDKGGQKGSLKLTDLTERFKHYRQSLEQHLYNESSLKAREKDEKKAKKKEEKAQKAAAKKQNEPSAQRDPQLFVIHFKGSIDAREVEALREEVTAILSVATEQDEVLVNVESGGGMVHGYGLAASQLARFRQAGVPLTVAVDKVAASGGYMMACVADKLIAAPFAIIGSIGVIAQLPNFNKLLKKNDIEFEQLTAGEFKRTLTMFGENTDKAREKFKTELEETHGLFKAFISEYRPSLNVDKVATGEHWFGNQALDLGLIDEVCTSDEYLFQAANNERKVLSVSYHQRKNIAEKLAGASAEVADRVLLKWISRGQRPLV
ncbi:MULTISPECIES: protease SohB [unclassified Salinivibrio]|uniref:protease SohB n=1 Tax=unclassified Salinivibrio TaxID=2636825 RepID=UPI000984763C|nr:MULTISPECIES: protease SohB [unclassified Salinivibrio]MPX91525.1 protease SohB [Salinivibrio sp. VYel1]OOE69708.1 protease SohB [Salinivibrio sp. IB868]OOE73457.1 protease SohB [Salinivibrio sp. IB870]